jgi:hypothetical protein
MAAEHHVAQTDKAINDTFTNLKLCRVGLDSFGIASIELLENHASLSEYKFRRCPSYIVEKLDRIQSLDIETNVR